MNNEPASQRKTDAKRWWERRDATGGAAGGWQRGRWLVAATVRRRGYGNDLKMAATRIVKMVQGAFAQDAEDEIRLGWVTVGPRFAGPVRFPVGEDHDHGVKGLESPSGTCENKVFELPIAEFAAVAVEHGVDAEAVDGWLMVVFFGRWDEG
ncbi:hypothetical protein E3N88_08716 [Mikania micrantha]|uniref:Uncharacterized protein n=1 Tax=Mikania micrantha TaxID=192012 RepID=A0A5N6PGZ7_9ASTR|nr:hypothetical protein E3N88_08716 [Mikania micrantha]